MTLKSELQDFSRTLVCFMDFPGLKISSFKSWDSQGSTQILLQNKKISNEVQNAQMNARNFTAVHMPANLQ